MDRCMNIGHLSKTSKIQLVVHSYAGKFSTKSSVKDKTLLRDIDLHLIYKYTLTCLIIEQIEKSAAKHIITDLFLFSLIFLNYHFY